MAEITFETFSRKLIAAGQGVKEHESAITLAGASALASDVASAYKVATGGDGRLSGTGKARNLGKGAQRGGSGSAVSVSARSKDVRHYEDGTYVALVVPTGPYGLVERAIKPHIIAPFSVSASQRRRKVNKAVRAARKGDTSAVAAARLVRASLDAGQSHNLLIPGIGYRRSVRHPGTKGKDVFSRTVRAAGPRVAQRMAAETSKQMLAGYQGRS